VAAPLTVSIHEHFVPLVAATYLRTLTHSVVVDKNPSAQDSLFLKGGLAMVFGDFTATVTYLRALDSPGADMNLSILSAGASLKL
jgi:hypothetical protein